LVKYKDSVDGYLDLAERFGDQIEARITSGYMPATVLATDVDAYIEPYLLADLPKRRDLMLASFEARFSRSSYMYDNLRDYAEFVFASGTDFADFSAHEEDWKDRFWRSFVIDGRIRS